LDSVFCDGYQYTGPFNVIGTGDWPSDSFPPSPGYEWWLTRSPSACLWGNSGEAGCGIVTISTSDSLGSFQMAFLAARHSIDPVSYYFEGLPCSCTVEVVPLKLELETWAHI